MNNVLYLCDKKGCCGLNDCPGDGYCEHTTDIEHAVNFEKMDDESYWEKKKEQSKCNDILILKCNNARIATSALHQLHADLLEMKETGIVIVPWFCDIVSVQGVSDIKIEVE